MTLDEIRKNRQQEGNYSAIKEKTDVAVHSSRDIPDNVLSVKQFSSPFDGDVNSNTTSEAGFRIRQRSSVSGQNFEGVAVCGEDTVLFNRKMVSEKNDDISTKPASQIQLGGRVGHDGARTGENLIENCKNDIVIKTLAEIRAEKESLIENSSSCIIKKRSHSPIVFDCLPQKCSCRNVENEGVGNGGEGKKKKPVIIRKHILEPGPNPDEKDPSNQPKKLRRFVRRTLHQQVSETKSDSEGTPRKPLKLRRNVSTTVAASESSRIIRLTSDSLKNSEFTVEVPCNINSSVCSDLLKMNGTFCVETGGSDCDQAGQPLTDISGDCFRPDSMSVTTVGYDENSSTPFNVSRSDVFHSSDLSLQTTADSPANYKYPDPAVNELDGDRVGVMQSSELLLSERLESKLACTKDSDDMFVAKGKHCSVRPLSIFPIEHDSRDTDEELLLGSGQDSSLTLDAGEDILQDIDDLLND
jgi:hypothetical protein